MSLFTRKLALLTFALAALLAACQPTASLPTATPLVVDGRVVTATPSSTPQPTPLPSATPLDLPDLTGSTIPLGLLCDRSGIFAGGDAGRIAAVEDAVAALNSGGGIFGAQLELRFVNTEGTIEGAQRADARLRREVPDVALLLLCNPQDEGALSETLNEDNIPALSAGTFATPGGALFGLDASPEQSLAFFLADLAANWEARQPAGSGPEIRLAVLSWPAEQVGIAATEAALAYAQELGIQIVMHSEFPAALDANIFDLVYEARTQNANAIYINARSFGLASILNAIADLGLQHRFVLGAPGAAYDADLYSYLAAPEHAQGLYLVSPWAGWAESSPGVEQLRTLDGETYDWGYIQMAGAVDLARRAMEDVILEDRLDALTPAAVRSALESLQEYPVLDGLYSVDYTAGTRTLSQLRVWQVGAAAGELAALGGYAAAPALSE